MEGEKFTSPPESQEQELDRKIKEGIMFELNKRGLFGDTFQAWSKVLYCTEPKLIKKYLATPVQTYEERLRQDSVSGPYADFILENSDPKLIAENDAMVAEFNQQREEIRQNKDLERIQEYANKVSQFHRRVLKR